ncbi:MAG: hypothetical protein RL456_1979 [Pseudomonadota bacterium]
MPLPPFSWSCAQPLPRLGARCAPWLVACLLAMPAHAGPGVPAPVPADDPSFSYTLTDRDTLIALGRRFLADPGQWPQLQARNRIADPRRMPAGTVLRIPLRLMAAEPVPARVLSASGDVRDTDGRTVAVGQAVPQGGSLRTGDGQATIELVDGTVLRLRSATSLQVDASRRLPQAGGALSGVRVEEGQVEVKAQKAPAGGLPGFRVSTPQGLLGVRGTEFRVTVDGRAEVTRNEVLEGLVMTGGHDGRPGQAVGAGFGVVVDRTGEVPAPARLPGAPDLSAWPARQERLLVRFPVGPQPGAVAFRGQVAAAADERFERVLKDVRTAGAELRFADLPDGDYVVRVRAEDARGLQGLDARHAFTLKARPEPPLPTSPGPQAILSGSRLDLAWATVEEARSYRLQLARTEDFREPLQDRRGLAAPASQVEGLAPGRYFWRVASERGATDQGPFGAVHRVELRAEPAPVPPPSIGEDGIRLAWEGRPGQTFDVEFARDAGFTALELVRRVDVPALEARMPGTGRYFLRLRARDPDGFVGPYTAPQQFLIPECLRGGPGRCVAGGDGGPVLIGP